MAKPAEKFIIGETYFVKAKIPGDYRQRYAMKNGPWRCVNISTTHTTFTNGKEPLYFVSDSPGSMWGRIEG